MFAGVRVHTRTRGTLRAAAASIKNTIKKSRTVKKRNTTIIPKAVRRIRIKRAIKVFIKVNDRGFRTTAAAAPVEYQIAKVVVVAVAVPKGPRRPRRKAPREIF